MSGLGSELGELRSEGLALLESFGMLMTLKAKSISFRSPNHVENILLPS